MAKILIIDENNPQIQMHLSHEEALNLNNKLNISRYNKKLKNISNTLLNFYTQQKTKNEKLYVPTKHITILKNLLSNEDGATKDVATKDGDNGDDDGDDGDDDNDDDDDDNDSDDSKTDDNTHSTNPCKFFIILSYKLKLSSKSKLSFKELSDTKIESIYEQLNLAKHFNKHSETDYFDTVSAKKYGLKFHHSKITFVKSHLYLNIMYSCKQHITSVNKLIHNFYIGSTKHWYKEPEEHYILYNERKYIVEIVDAKQPDVVITNDGMVYKKTAEKIKDIEDNDLFLEDIVSPFKQKHHLSPFKINTLPLLPTTFNKDKVDMIRKYNDLAKSYYELGTCHEYKNLVHSESMSYLQQHEIVQLYGPHNIYIYCYSVKQLFYLYKQRGYMYNPMAPDTALSNQDKDRIENLFILNGLHWRHSTMKYI